MYGKHFESMYEGSMYGAGLDVFAVWGYVIAHTKRSRVELNPKRLSDTLGGDIPAIDKAIEFLMAPDPISRHKEHEGRRLIKEGQFQYFVPSWEAYQVIKNAEDRREYNRVKKSEQRARDASTSNGTPERFQKPSTTELVSEGLSISEAEKFWHYYESKGWKVGKTPMKSWKSAVANWKKSSFNSTQSDRPAWMDRPPGGNF